MLAAVEANNVRVPVLSDQYLLFTALFGSTVASVFCVIECLVHKHNNSGLSGRRVAE